MIIAKQAVSIGDKYSQIRERNQSVFQRIVISIKHQP